MCVGVELRASPIYSHLVHAIRILGTGRTERIPGQYTRVQRESGGAGSLKTVFNSDEPTLFAEIRLEKIRSLVPLRHTHYGSARTAQRDRSKLGAHL
jgi:hypothetical protein